ncbi:MAG: GNAT family protein [Alphaproteobacteria bacterium]|nr:GNAT family protein [Alphaproteobacteria bacterium]
MLNNGRVALIPFARRHLPLLYGWLNDVELRAAMGEVTALTELQVEQYFDRASRDPGHAAFIIYEAAARVEVGFITLKDIGPVHRRGELSIAIGRPDKRRQGFAADAIQVLCQHAFGNLGLERIWLTVRTDNVGAIALYRRCGFVEEGTLQRFFFCGNRWVDALIMARLKPKG